MDQACAAIVERQTAADNEDVSSVQTRIVALKDRLKGLVHQALSQGSAQIKIESVSDESPRDITRRDRKILTLYGGSSSNAKQLFSSLQKLNDTESASDKPATFPEDRLPNGITTTRAIPFNLEMAERPVKTFGEVFAPRSTLAQLEPPRRGRAWARDQSSTWVDSFDAITNYDAILGQKHHHSFVKLPSGHWLHYGGDSASPSYWNRREEQNRLEETEASTRNAQSARNTNEDTALLYGAYSSFAPSFDSSHAMIQSDAKNSMWWAKRGSRRFNTMLALHKATRLDEDQTLTELDETTLEEDVKSFIEKGSLEAKSEETGETALEDKDVDALLQDISELLQTLDSFRRNRNLELPSQGESKTDDKAGTPSSPSAAELATYETLKSGLAAIISNLPPYAVAKLNGDQLAELNISQKILVEMPTYNGTMEEDDYSLLQRRLAATAPAATPSRTGSYQATSGYNQRMYPTNTRPQQPAAGPQGYYQGRPSSSTPYTPGASTPQQNYAGLRPQVSPSQRPSNIPAYSPGQYQPPRATPNNYGPYSGQSAPSPGPGYQQNPAYAAGRSASPQKPQGYATPQTAARTAYLNPASGNAQRYYPQQTGHSPAVYTNYAPSATPTPGQYAMSPNVAAAHYRSAAAEQAMALARHKAQIEASRQVSGTPNPPQSIAQASSQGRSESPATKQSATPTPAT